MRFVVRVERKLAATWEVVVTGPAKHEPPIARRVIGCRSACIPFPQPVDSDDADEPDAGLESELARTTDPAAIEQVYFDIAGRDPTPGAIDRFGAYLFAVLLGNPAWEAICRRASDEPVELALLWATSEWELTRLPWEMMRSPRGFLAVDPHRQVAITRLVADVEPTARDLAIQPRALFVIGADLEDVAIRPGAEYLGLLRRLRARNVSLNSRVLQRASAQRLQDAIAAFKPSIVHFICHGGLDDDHRGYLTMASDDDLGQDQRYFAESLLPLLRAGGLAPVVVLNACYAGSPPADRLVAPLAAELVRGGIPVAVGMAGRVADRACRLFTRRFYEALLQGESVAQAAAEGRRAGMVHGGDPCRLADWALPTLFLGASVSPEVRMDDELRILWSDVEARVYSYLTQDTPPFCDRLEVREEAYQELISPRSMRVARVLAVEVDGHDKGTEAPRYGKTRLLEELAAQAVRDGHVPCLVKSHLTEEPPSSCVALGLRIVEEITRTRSHFGLDSRPADGFQVQKLRDKLTHPSAVVELHPRVQQALDLQPPGPGGRLVLTPRLLRVALQVDLEALAREARHEQRFAAEGHVLVLIDDVERFDAAAGALAEMLGPYGLGTADDPVPVIFAFSGGVAEGALRTAITSLRTFLERKPWYVKHVRIRQFRPPAEDPLPYQQFLLGHQPPLVVRATANESQVTALFEMLYENSMGAPSLLEAKEVRLVITAAKNFNVLEEADDDAILRGMRGA